ncbi:hypothetical protein [Streptomyces sp. LN590]|uniref:hypothetical protein n=1 Tax=Streptomyces sp. LN590 TaxID=3112980 RepID=UPI00371AEE3E
MGVVAGAVDAGTAGTGAAGVVGAGRGLGTSGATGGRPVGSSAGGPLRSRGMDSWVVGRSGSGARGLPTLPMRVVRTSSSLVAGVSGRASAGPSGAASAAS